VLLNETKTVLGNYIYHEAALRGNCAYTFVSLQFPWPFPSTKKKYIGHLNVVSLPFDHS
jgi:hypothetical protein